MCQIQTVKFRCGHSRQVLLQACQTAAKLAPLPPKRAPNFCLEGLHIVNTILYTAEECGRGSNSYGCLENQALKGLDKKYSDLEDELASFSKRVERIKAVLNLRMEPDYNSAQSESQCRARFMEDQKQLRTISLPLGIQKWSATMNLTQKRLNEVYELTVLTLIKTLRNSTLTLEPAVCAWLQENYGPVEDIKNPIMTFFQDRGEELRQEAHNELVFLEEGAVRACLDDVGWLLPKEEEDRAWLEECMRDRLLGPASTVEWKILE